mmetsp:Transcript_11092/g.44935  ORF Transcript_11092/g.44935 Transcript_11092/m.44935 type:complete len:346 (-) Transcript_11092:225-1262(-)
MNADPSSFSTNLRPPGESKKERKTSGHTTTLPLESLLLEHGLGALEEREARAVQTEHGDEPQGGFGHRHADDPAAAEHRLCGERPSSKHRPQRRRDARRADREGEVESAERRRREAVPRRSVFEDAGDARRRESRHGDLRRPDERRREQRGRAARERDRGPRERRVEQRRQRFRRPRSSRVVAGRRLGYVRHPRQSETGEARQRRDGVRQERRGTQPRAEARARVDDPEREENQVEPAIRARREPPRFGRRGEALGGRRGQHKGSRDRPVGRAARVDARAEPDESGRAVRAGQRGRRHALHRSLGRTWRRRRRGDDDDRGLVLVFRGLRGEPGRPGVEGRRPSNG